MCVCFSEKDFSEPNTVFTQFCFICVPGLQLPLPLSVKQVLVKHTTIFIVHWLSGRENKKLGAKIWRMKSCSIIPKFCKWSRTAAAVLFLVLPAGVCLWCDPSLLLWTRPAWSMDRIGAVWRDRNTRRARWGSPEGSGPARWLRPAPEADLRPPCDGGGCYSESGRGGLRGVNDTRSVLCDMTSLPQSMLWWRGEIIPSPTTPSPCCCCYRLTSPR